MNIVQFERRKLMNTVVTSKEAILEVSRQIIAEDGWSAVSIRNVAGKCGVSIGSIYNYFSSKGDLVAQTIESVWHDIFHLYEHAEDFDDFIKCVRWIFESAEKGSEKYPGFFSLHSMSFLSGEKSHGKKLMERSRKHMRNGLMSALNKDNNIRSDAFGESLSKEQFIDIIFSMIVSALLKENYNCGAIIEIIKRTIY